MPFLFSASLVLGAGCQSKGPVPQGESPSTGSAPVSATETTGAHPGAANPHAGLGDPHAGMAPAPGAASGTSGMPDESGMVDLGAISFKVPEKWKAVPPASAMRKAQLMALGSEGPAELVIYYFGPQGAGSSTDNIQRWVGQFTTANGQPVTDAKVVVKTISGHSVDRVEVAGSYASGMGAPNQPQTVKADQRLLAAIVSTGMGPYYFKFLGPNGSVTENADAFDGLLESIVASP